MNVPTISVIVPVYNVEKYIHRCVDSILAQTFTDFELILVDDGSPDNCGKICDEYAKKDSRVRVIHKENGGVSSARNAGLDIAQGEYVTFVDSDDWIDSLYIEMLYRAIEQSGADMAVCGYSIIDKLGNISNDYAPADEILSNTEALKYYGMIGNSCFRAPWNKLIRKKIVNDNLFPTDRAYSEDFAVVYKWMYASNLVVGVNLKLYNYYLSDTGICRTFNKSWLSNFQTLNEMLSFYKKHKLKDLYEFYLYDTVQCGRYFLSFEEVDITTREFISEKIKTTLIRHFNVKRLRPCNYPIAWEACFPKTYKIFLYLSLIFENGFTWTVKKIFKRIWRTICRQSV